MSYESKFVPDECKGSNRAITVGVRADHSPGLGEMKLTFFRMKAGVTFEQVYQFADENESTFVGGYAQTIGVSGGWLMVLFIVEFTGVQSHSHILLGRVVATAYCLRRWGWASTASCVYA